MAMKLGEIARALGCELVGNPEAEITGVAGMEHAAAGELTFLANPKYAHKVKDTRASAILTEKALGDVACLVSSNPYLDFARALELFYQPPKPRPGIHPLASVAASARIAEAVAIGPCSEGGEEGKIARVVVLP